MAKAKLIPIDAHKNYRTRKGNEVVIYSMYIGKPPHIIHAAYRNESGWIPVAYTMYGRIDDERKSNLDLVEHIEQEKQIA